MTRQFSAKSTADEVLSSVDLKEEQLWAKSEDMVVLKEEEAVTVIGIIGAGEVGSQIARAAIANGYKVVI